MTDPEPQLRKEVCDRIIVEVMLAARSDDGLLHPDDADRLRRKIDGLLEPLVAEGRDENEALRRSARTWVDLHNKARLSLNLARKDAQRQIDALEEQCQKLQDANERWLTWSESRGPGLEAYRELGQKVAELEATIEQLRSER